MCFLEVKCHFVEELLELLLTVVGVKSCLTVVGDGSLLNETLK